LVKISARPQTPVCGEKHLFSIWPTVASG